MKHLYKIEGMSCNSCRQKIEDALNSASGIRKAIVTLSPPKAEIEMDRHISDQELQKVISGAGNYTVNFDAAKLTSGVYLYKIKTSTGFSSSKKMSVIK